MRRRTIRSGARRLARGLAACSLGAILFLPGCKSGGIEDDPILRLSAEESLARGKELVEAGKYNQAGEYLTHAFEVAPNSATGREALLLAGDALFQAGGLTNYIKAEAKYRDFQNRFPTSDRAAYVQLQIANSLAQRVLRADRDQTSTRQALEVFDELVTLYPTSEYVEEARQRKVELRTTLAEHEFVVGRYNLRRRLYAAATQRFERLLADYPDYPEIDKVLLHMGLAHHRAEKPEEAAAVFERLRAEYPDSEYLEKIPHREKT